MNRRLLVLPFFFLSTLLYSQYGAVTYLDAQLNPVDSKEKASYFLGTNEDLDVEVFYFSGKLKMKGQCLSENDKKYHGPFVYYHPNGKVESQGMYHKGKKVGEWKRFSSSGQSKGSRYYANAIDSFDHGNHPAKYEGGEKALLEFLSNNMKEPAAVKAHGIGKVEVSFLITSAGRVENVAIVSTTDTIFNREAIRLTNMLDDWIPATKEGSPVDSSFILPIIFNNN